MCDGSDVRLVGSATSKKSHNLLTEVDGAKTQAPKPKPKAKGHGRKAAQDYPGALKKPPAEKFCRYARSPQQHGAVSPPASPSRLCFSSLAQQGDPIMEGRLIRANRRPAENMTFSRADPYLSGDAKLSATVSAAIRDPNNQVFLSAVSFWEISVLPQPPGLG